MADGGPPGLRSRPRTTEQLHRLAVLYSVAAVVDLLLLAVLVDGSRAVHVGFGAVAVLYLVLALRSARRARRT